MRGASGTAGLIALGVFDLLRTQALLPEDGRPRRGRVAASQVLLVDRFMAAPAIAGRQHRGNDKAVMVPLLLARGGLMAVQAIDAFFGVSAQLELVDDRVLLLQMAF